SSSAAPSSRRATSGTRSSSEIRTGSSWSCCLRRTGTTCHPRVEDSGAPDTSVRSWQGVAVATASSSRRIGAEDSKTRAQLVDAAERLLIDEGYAAVTSRRVAAKAGLKPQLVHYYFRTMDDLFLEVLRRRADHDLARFEQAIAADGSLRNLWR